ncbi:MAG: molybdopterin-dependent oxidoreductase [Syntrophaceae bacterium]|nr:molybdopterin-dependent oxidoreductase [Syntrophaceae bacterium]
MNEVYKTVCMLCFQACGINAYVQDKRLIKVDGMKEHPCTKGVICPRGVNLPDYVYSPKRLKYPMRKKSGDWQRISWEEALDSIAGKLQEIKSEFGSRSVAFSVGSIGAENIEISAFAQRLRGNFGTPNFFSIEAHCFRSRIMARLLTFGTYPLEDPDNSECIILWGHNPDASEPPLAGRIYNSLERGLKLIVIDPKRIPLARHGLHVQPRIGTDCALALSMMNVIIQEEIYDKQFVEEYTAGFDRLKEHVRVYSPETVAEICSLSAGDIRKISRVFANAKSSSIIQGINSLDDHINGLQNNRALAILHAITGNYDIPGGWATNPFMRLTDLRIPVEGEPIGADEHPLFRSLLGMTSPYGQQMHLPDVIMTEKPYPIKALIVNGGNPAAAWPNSGKVQEAFQKLEMLIVMDLFMTETAELAHMVLPACSSMEKMALAYNYGLTMGMPYVLLSRKVIEPLGKCWPDWKFYTELGRRLGFGEYFPWDSDEEVVEILLEASGITLQQLQENPEGLWFGNRCYDINAPKQIRTPSGRIELYSQTLSDAGYDPMPVHREPSQSLRSSPELVCKYPLILNTGARIPEYTHWQMRDIPVLRNLASEPVAEIHPDTASEYRIGDGDTILVETRGGRIKVKVKTTKDLMCGVVNVLHGWQGKYNQNILTEMKPLDPITGYPELRALACRIEKAEQ